jgi:RNA polymerase sigma factor (TIGR02999 family)
MEENHRQAPNRSFEAEDHPSAQHNQVLSHQPPINLKKAVLGGQTSGFFSLMTQPDEPKLTEANQPAAELLPVLYEELRRLAAVLTTRLSPGQTLQPTALVHEAYLRLVRGQDPGWEGRRHFFGAAAKAMREILIEQARQKASFKHGGQSQRIELAEGLVWIEPPSGNMIALDEAIQELHSEDPHLAELVQLRYYTGLSVEQTAGVLGVSVSTLKRDWRYARAWLARRLGEDTPR